MNNYHTHTYRCRHATGDVRDYVEAARRAGIKELGFSDHVPQPDGRWANGCRMLYDELPGYLEAVRAAQRSEAPRAEKGLDIFLGLECEYASDLYGYYHDELLGERGLDYLVAGIHVYEIDGVYRDSFYISDSRGLAAYARQVEKAASSGLFAFLAHPDVYCGGYYAWDASAEACARDVLAACEAAGLPIEINGNGLRKPLIPAPEGMRRPYPHPRFWELASEYNITALACSDAHNPEDVGQGLEECKAMALDFGIDFLEALPFSTRRQSVARAS
jgi:histidinol-phosphatase (PHP family)